MTSLLINKGSFRSPLVLPRSKSFANRALILAAFSKKTRTLHEVPSSSDVAFLVRALQQIGLIIEITNTTHIIKNSFPECEVSPQKIEIGEGGTTARFLACLLLKGSLSYELILGNRLKDRPWKSFLKLVNDLGGKASLSGSSLFLQGPIKLPPTLEVDCSQTTQFASGLQLAFPETVITPQSLNTSQSYWHLTLELIREINQSSVVTVPVDWSSASYPLAFAALNQNLYLPGLVFDPFQADAKFLPILREFGAIESESSDGITVFKHKLSRELKASVEDCLDLVPALAFFLAHIPGQHRLCGVENLVHKESDRLSEVRKLLLKFNRKTEFQGKDLIIHGTSEILNHTLNLDFPDDHRMVMAGSLFLMHHSGGYVSPLEAVNKSYPQFFSQLNV